MKTFILFIFFIKSAIVYAQSSYIEAIKQGDDAFDRMEYKTAINKYFAAEAFDPTKKDLVKAKVNRAFDAIETLRAEAERAKKDAIKAEAKAKTALAKAEKFINAFYFYDNKYALILKVNPKQDEKYSFINKEGNAVFENRYEKAEQFDEHGFAKVQIWEGSKYGECCSFPFNYLMDTTGKRYRVSYRLDSLNTDVDALDWRGKRLDGFPPGQIPALAQLELLLLQGDSVSKLPGEIGKLKELRSLYVSHAYLKELPPEIGLLQNLQSLNLLGNRLQILPPEIGQLKNLQTLNLGHNLLKNLPKEIGELKKLTTLVLSGNNIPPTEIEKIKKLLPHCKIQNK